VGRPLPLPQPLAVGRIDRLGVRNSPTQNSKEPQFEIALGTGEGLLFVRPVEEAGTAETSTASAADCCAATELTGYSRTKAIERRGDPIK
jgi:hypothetical protein